ncbi:MAG: GumC family protein [Nitrospiraceae bacterium]
MTPIDVELQLSQSATDMVREYWRMVVRQKWVIIGSLVLSLTVAWAYCLFASKQYRSETLILVEEQKMPENYVQGVVEGNLEQRIFVIQKQIISRAVLSEVVKELNLYPDEASQYGADAAIAKVASAIRVEMVAKGVRGNFVSRSSVDAFTVSFSHEDPGIAMTVTSRIANKFLEENVKARERTAEGTTEFFEDEVTGAKSVLDRKEDEISKFKSKHIGGLPQQTEANLRALDRLQSDLNAGNETIQRLSDRLAMMDKAIQEYQRFGATNAALVASPIEPDPLFRRLKELREKSVRLKAEFWDSYPEVLLTKEEIRQVEGELMALYGQDAIKPGEKPIDPYLQDLKRQQREVKTELVLLQQRQIALRAERKDYEKRVEKSPEVEQELLILERDYENMKNNYRSLLDKRLNARVAENLEKRQQAGHFRILDPANFPRRPEKPNRSAVMVFGLLIGCVFGIGATMIREQLNLQFHRPEDVERVVGPKLLAMIPDFSLIYGRTSWQRFLPNYRVAREANGLNGEGEARPILQKRLIGHSGDNLPFELNLVVKYLPASIVAEQYRVAATRLVLVGNKGRSTIVVVTSAVKGEGKTTTVVNLGYTLARDLGKRTLLLDCDFKCPMLNRYAETVPERGLADCLTGEVSPDECLYGFEEVPCWIMPAGNGATRSNELLKTDRLSSILAQLCKQFDYILINAPPILPLADMNVLAEHADLSLLVVRAGSTPHQAVKSALRSLRADAPVHAILNAVTGQFLPYYMYGYAQSPNVQTTHL